MTNQGSNTTGQAPTHRERFAEACKVTDFLINPKAVAGYYVWALTTSSRLAVRISMARITPRTRLV